MKKLIVLILITGCSSHYQEPPDVQIKYATGCHTLAGCLEVLSRQAEDECRSQNKKLKRVDQGWEYRKVYLKYNCV